jgi:hypothetical protein
MATAFLNAVIDTLVPGGELANGVVAPAASAIGLAGDLGNDRSARVLAAIADAAGSEDDFRSGTEDFRASVIMDVEKTHTQDFIAFVTKVLTLYYEHPDVLAAFSWPSRPPQPLGHEMPPFDEELLGPVLARGEFWREK